MPTFTTVKEGSEFWLPEGRIAMIESGPGGLISIVHAILVDPKTAQNVIGKIEVQGRASTLGAAIDAGRPTEVGQ